MFQRKICIHRGAVTLFNNRRIDCEYSLRKKDEYQPDDNIIATVFDRSFFAHKLNHGFGGVHVPSESSYLYAQCLFESLR